MKHLATIQLHDKTYRLVEGNYVSGARMLQLESEVDPTSTARLTVNIPDTALQPGEFLIKTWSENEPLREPLLATGFFIDTGVRVLVEFVKAEVWSLAALTQNV